MFEPLFRLVVLLLVPNEAYFVRAAGRNFRPVRRTTAHTRLAIRSSSAGTAKPIAMSIASDVPVSPPRIERVVDWNDQSTLKGASGEGACGDGDRNGAVGGHPGFGDDGVGGGVGL